MLNSEEAARLCVVLVATRNPLNMGAAARAMSNFGFDDLRVVRPYEAAFREARSAIGALALLRNAREYPSVAEAIADCSLVIGTSAGSRYREALHPILRLEAAAPQVQHTLKQASVALLFGSEKFGLSNDDLSHCNWLMYIPARPEHPSMNLGQAVALCLYELIRSEDSQSQTTQSLFSAAEPVPTAQTEQLSSLVLEILEMTGYTGRHPRANMDAELRRLLRRVQLNIKDTQAVLGMLRQVIWKLRGARN